MQFVDHDQIFQCPRSEEECVSLFQWHCRTELWLIVIVTEMGDLIQITGKSKTIHQRRSLSQRLFDHLLVAKVGRHKQETRFHDAHCRRRWHRIEIFEFDFRYDFVVRFQRHFEYVALFRLHQKEVHRLGAMCCGRNENHAALRIVQIVTATRYRTPNVVLIAEIFVRQIVFGADQHAGWAIIAAGH